MSSKKRRRKRKSEARRAVRRGIATGSTVTLATLGLSNCTDGGGGTAVDPLPPPALVCADANQGQNLHGTGAVQDSTLTVTFFSGGYLVGIDTLFVTNVVGAALDTVDIGRLQLAFTLDTDTTSQVTFTLGGTFNLVAGPCDFSRDFTVTIDNGNVDIAQRRLSLPIGAGRDIRIELVERDGLQVRLKAAGATDVTWRVTAGAFEARGDGEIVWQLPSTPGFYQVELVVDRDDRGFGFDALSFEVT